MSTDPHQWPEPTRESLLAQLRESRERDRATEQTADLAEALSVLDVKHEGRSMVLARLLDCADRLASPEHRGNRFAWPDNAEMIRSLARALAALPERVEPASEQTPAADLTEQIADHIRCTIPAMMPGNARRIAESLLAAGFGPVRAVEAEPDQRHAAWLSACGRAELWIDRAEQAEAERGYVEHDYDARGEKLWRLAALAGHVPGESDNDADAELVVAEAIAERDALRESVEALAEEATERTYFEIAAAKMLTIMPTGEGRAAVPGHWRDEAEAAAVVPVAQLRALLATSPDREGSDQ